MDFFLLLLWLSLTAFFAATALATAIRYRRLEKPRGELPPCSIILPIKGVSQYLESNLRALVRLVPPQSEILLAVASDDDPGFARGAFIEAAKEAGFRGNSWTAA